MIQGQCQGGSTRLLHGKAHRDLGMTHEDTALKTRPMYWRETLHDYMKERRCDGLCLVMATIFDLVLHSTLSAPYQVLEIMVVTNVHLAIELQC